MFCPALCSSNSSYYDVVPMGIAPLMIIGNARKTKSIFFWAISQNVVGTNQDWKIAFKYTALSLQQWKFASILGYLNVFEWVWPKMFWILQCRLHKLQTDMLAQVIWQGWHSLWEGGPVHKTRCFHLYYQAKEPLLTLYDHPLSWIYNRLCIKCQPPHHHPN